MANQAGPVCRLCRREGVKLYLKGAKCVTNCTFDKRSGLLPGQHGLARRRKASDYGIQLRAKQKARRIYGVLETQFRHYFERAEGADGVTGTVLLQQLERRLDNVVYRLGLASSRREARQFVSHRHFKVNGRTSTSLLRSSVRATSWRSANAAARCWCSRTRSRWCRAGRSRSG